MCIRPLSDYDLLPMYMRVADDLRAKFGEQGFEFGAYLPGEHEIAAGYNLSRGTIRRALGILEAEGLLSRQPGRGTLILPPITQEQGIRPKVAVVWTMMRWMSMDMFSALEENISAANCDLLFSSSQHDYQKESEILTGLLNADVDAIVLYSTVHPNAYPLIQKLQNQGKPVILLDRFFQDQSDHLSWVTSENEEGAYQVTRHLIELGHKRISMVIRSPEYQCERISTLVERESGYIRAMDEAGLESLLMKKCCPSNEDSNIFGQELLAFIDSYQPTAIFFHNDASAFRMYTLLKQAGIRVPQDISIAGFDGLVLLDDLLGLDLTTVKQDFTGLGHQVGKLVQLFLRNPNRQHMQIRLPVKLHIGKSTAPPQRDSDVRQRMTQSTGVD